MMGYDKNAEHNQAMCQKIQVRKCYGYLFERKYSSLKVDPICKRKHRHASSMVCRLSYYGLIFGTWITDACRCQSLQCGY